VGKIRAAFHLSCRVSGRGNDEFWLELDAGEDSAWDRALAQAIDEFTFAEKQTLSDPIAQECAWLFGEASAQAVATAVASGLTTIEHGARDFGRPWWSVWGESSKIAEYKKTLSGAHVATPGQLQEWRTEVVRPWYGNFLSQDVMPLELGLLDGVSQGKGCYPGQEVIERIITQGAPPRRLARVRLADGSRKLSLVRKGDANAGAAVQLDGAPAVVEQVSGFEVQ